MKHLDFGAYEALTRTEKYEELKRVAPEAARGQSRATAAKLYELYAAACAALPVAEIVPLLTDEEPNARVTALERQEDLSGIPVAPVQLAAAVPDHIHGPGCGHMERVNPEMPDGVIALPPQQVEREFVFKEGDQSRPLDTRQQALWARMVRAFEAFCKNAADSSARREAKSGIYSLRVAGVIAHPDYARTLAKGAADVRDARKLARQGVSASG